MNIIRRLVNRGTARQTNNIYNKHIRFTNSISLIVCFFIIQNIALSIYYHQQIAMAIQVMHLVAIALVPYFNFRGKRILATSWFSGAAIIFVTVYAVIFTAITVLCFAGAVLYPQLHEAPLLPIPQGLLVAQRMNSLVGIPILSILFGVYAFSTINKAEQESCQGERKNRAAPA